MIHFRTGGRILVLENYIAEAINRMVSAKLEPTVHLKHLQRVGANGAGGGPIKTETFVFDRNL